MEMNVPLFVATQGYKANYVYILNIKGSCAKEYQYQKVWCAANDCWVVGCKTDDCLAYSRRISSCRVHSSKMFCLQQTEFQYKFLSDSPHFSK